jgi:hypothetical protein
MKPGYGLFLSLLFLTFQAGAEPLRALVAGKLDLSQNNPAGASIPLGYNGAALIGLEGDTRFFRGIQMEISAPQLWLAYRGTLAMAVYAELDKAPPPGIADIQARRIAFEPLPNKIQMVYQIPVRNAHGLRSSPYITVLTGVVPPASFPLLFRIFPVSKGLSEELETMVFQLHAKPVLSDEGAVRFQPRFPEQLPGRPFTVLIDDVVIENPGEERLLKEGEHHLMVLSEDYRNESRRFKVERAKTLELTIDLQDPAPLMIFEGPENARIFLDEKPVPRTMEPVLVEPGLHEVKFQVGDYTVIRSVQVQRGKTYRMALAVDITVSESD